MSRYAWTVAGVKYEVLPPYDGQPPGKPLLSVNGRSGVVPSSLSAAQVSAVLEELLSLGERWAVAEERLKSFATASGDVLDGFDEGLFVRGTAEDDLPEWAMKAVRSLAALGKLAKEAGWLPPGPK